MKQVTQTQRKGLVRVEDVPSPALRPGGVLVRTAFSLISAGTERAKVELAQRSLVGKARARPEQAREVLATLRQQGPVATYRKVMNRLAALQPLGYSCSGVVIAVGSGAVEFQVGDRVACAGAGYANHAEVNFVPKNLCEKVPEGVEPEEAAFATLGAIALQGVRQAEVRLGETVAVIGLGLVGLLAVQLLKAAGCQVIGMDPNPDRCRLSEELGCRATANSRQTMLTLASQITNGNGVDAAILAAATSSSEPVALAGRICRDKGRVVVVGAVGMSVPRPAYYQKELELRFSRSYGPGRYDPEYEEKGHDYPIGYVRWTEKRNMEAVLHLIAEGKVDVRSLISHRFPIAHAAQAYHLITKGEVPCLGVLLEYPEGATTKAVSDQGEKEGKLWLETGAAPTLPAGPGQPRLSIGLIGAGNFAQDVLLPALKRHKDVRLRGVVTASGLSARSAAERFGFAYTAAEPAEILADPEIAAVVIATRHDTHARLVVQALKAGKSVFVEKPLALTPAHLTEVVDAYQECLAQAPPSPTLMVGFNRRFAPATRAVKKFFASCTEPLAIHCRVNAGYLDPDHWTHDPEVGGGRIVGEGCHFVDLLAYLCDARPTEVYAVSLPDEGRYRQDNVVVQIRFANGSVGTLHYLANGDRRVGKERVEVFAGGGVAIIDDFQRVLLSRDGRLQRIGHWWTGQDKGHRAELEAFIDAVRKGGPSPTPFDQLMMSSLLTFRILESLQTGQPVRVTDVGLPETGAQQVTPATSEG